MMNKKGQGMSVETIILIVVGVLVLVFLVLGFTIGWGKIFPFINPGNNIKDVVDKCNYVCSTESQYDFCDLPRDVKLDRDLSQNGIMISTNKKISATCYDLLTVKSLGIASCGISCEYYSDIKFANLSCSGTFEDLKDQPIDKGEAKRYLKNSKPKNATCILPDTE